MRLLLIQPPVQDFYDTDIRLQPIGLCYLKGAVQKFLPNIEVIIRDFHRGLGDKLAGRRTVPIPSELRYLKEYYLVPDKSPFSTFFEYFHFGAPYEDIANEVKSLTPDLVGISSLFSPYYREALKTAETVKKVLDVPVLMGGSHVSACPELMLSNPNVDFIIRGEGEKPICDFLREFQAHKRYAIVDSLGWKENGTLRLNPIGDNFPIQELPPPDVSSLLKEHYLFEGKPIRFVITSRSCPHRCSFCSVHTTFGTKYRRNTVENVLSEIKESYELGYRVFDFEDDNLTFFRPEMKKLCEELIRAFPKKDVRFVAMNGISYISLDSELLCLMKDAGFTNLNLALVSSDKLVRETTKRPHTIEKYLQIVRESFELGFQITSYQILGLPMETLESMIQTLRFNAAQPVLMGASLFYLTPNSPIASDFPERNESDVFLSRLTSMAISSEHFEREDIYSLFIVTRILNFLKSVSVSKGNTVSLNEALRILEKCGIRSLVGVRLFEKLLDEKKLYASTSQDWILLEKFRYEVFEKVFSGLDGICTLSGGKIDLQDLNRFLPLCNTNSEPSSNSY
ncbi:radical SAM domain protein [Leptospira weilii str. 2006001853]|uniref:Radical SAM domain protein n=3 Tax=Leptospira weilii TaxID=28184 RepID=A0A828YYL2_9LEPT|nr:radical SAM protein [Leptospira weilii]EKR63308.1 radical SAM domain protein [Leptospira weilii str. 2006001853]EMN43841.1 radical SAM domain protein [Leptospira weilii str. LNT 1234]MCL8267142.1 B12-binding domain-containing radical SAM protein [Leptospira weilii]QDK21804.1 B12-binding domain-containing radical SAM protein [Leptospira weilii]QDK25742.1 B12-binding domain-containing radical SAM protein [Leptospira weilii]